MWKISKDDSTFVYNCIGGNGTDYDPFVLDPAKEASDHGVGPVEAGKGSFGDKECGRDTSGGVWV